MRVSVMLASGVVGAATLLFSGAPQAIAEDVTVYGQIVGNEHGTLHVSVGEDQIVRFDLSEFHNSGGARMVNYEWHRFTARRGDDGTLFLLAVDFYEGPPGDQGGDPGNPGNAGGNVGGGGGGGGGGSGGGGGGGNDNNDRKRNDDKKDDDKKR